MYFIYNLKLNVKLFHFHNISKFESISHGVHDAKKAKTEGEEAVGWRVYGLNLKLEK